MGRLSGGGGLVIVGPRLTDQEWCDDRNRTMYRQDIEWAVGPNGPYLRDREDFTRENTRQSEARREGERQRWLRNHRNAQ